MKTYEFRLKDGSKQYGFVSLVDVELEQVLVLGQHQVGSFGRDGTPLPFADLESVRRETTRTGVYDSEEQLTVWRRWARDRRK